MQCARCKADNDRVVDSRSCGGGGVIRRRRECLSCGFRFTTYERPETPQRMVIKKDGRREAFNREKILGGLRIACQKRPISNEQLLGIVDRIETHLLADADGEVETRQIGEKVIEELKALDKVAYVRFASVYREFTDVGEFVDALLPFLPGESLAKLRSAPPPPPSGGNGVARKVLLRKDSRNGSHPGGP
jgi:transcriptional repressor NrdR